MKKIILAALLTTIAAASQAHTLYTWANKSQGKMVVTDEVCQANPNQHFAYSTGFNTPVLLGCWFFDSDTNSIMISWADDNGQVRAYDLKNWTMSDYFRQRVAAQAK